MHIRYLVKDKNGIAYRRPVPADVQFTVGKKVWKERLNGMSPREAEKRVRELANAHDREIAAARGLPLPDKFEAARFVSEDARDAILARPEDTKRKAEYEKAAAAASKVELAMLAAAQQRLDTLPKEDREAIEQAGGLDAFFRRVPQQTSHLEDSRLTVRLQKAVRKISADDAQEELAKLDVRAQRLAKSQRTLERLGLVSEDADGAFEDENNPRIRAAMKLWFADKARKESTKRRHTVALNRFIELNGNIPVRDITKKMVRDFVKTLENLTDDRHLPVERRGKLNFIEDLPTISAPTIERHRSSIHAFLEFCYREQDWVSTNVADGVKSPKDTRPAGVKPRSMTRDEATLILKQAIKEEGTDCEKAWAIRLAAYTGARIREILERPRSSVKKIDGVWCLVIDDLEGRSLKNPESLRAPPLHPAIRDDFLAWFEKRKALGADTIFVSLKPGPASGDFGRLMDRAGIPDPSVVFHSFRHMFRTAMMDVGIGDDMRRAIMGHAKKDAHGGYGGVGLKRRLEELSKVPPLFDGDAPVRKAPRILSASKLRMLRLRRLAD